MKLLTYTSLYPDSTRPTHGIFVETRLRHLLAEGGIESRVVAPVPWFPFAHPRFGSYARFARVPRSEVWNGIAVEHPRYPLMPKIGMAAAPFFMAAATKATLERIIRDGYDFDVIDAHYFFPDGVAAALLGKALGKPVVITARGTDLNLIPQYRLPRRMIRWAAGRAAGLVTVCQALKDVLVGLNVASDRVTVLRNGVDLELFQPADDRESLRRELGIKGPTLLSVGQLLPAKGQDLVIQALLQLPEFSAIIIGSGPDQRRLASLVESLQLRDRVRFIPATAQRNLIPYYQAADASVLASSREGWANVLLESLACGTPVVTTRVGGSSEVITAPEAGELVDERTPKALASGIAKLFARLPDRWSVRRYAEHYDWPDTSRGLDSLFKAVVAG